MILAGLTGGIASGKSVVSRLFREEGAHIIDADQIAHEVIAPKGRAWENIVDVFGKGILLPDGSIDRKVLGAIVFDDPEKREQLNAIVHPRVFAEEEKRRKEIEKENPHAVVLFDVPLLIETGSYELMDKVILVYVDKALQIKRLMERDHLSKEESLKRIAAQMPLVKKKPYADYIIDGSKSLEKIQKRVNEIYVDLCRIQ